MIEAVVSDAVWSEATDPQRLAEDCWRATSALEPRAAGGVAALFADDDAVAALNQRFRSKSGPTNVLSFPSGDVAPAFLGDIALARETCWREAADKRVSPADHAAHLLVHGLLHLIGFDHQTDDDAQVMEALETKILARLGVADPYRDYDVGCFDGDRASPRGQDDRPSHAGDP